MERHGQGWARLPNNDQYEGNYKRGLRDGMGLYVFKNGARYLGEWHKGKKHGFGKFYYPDGSTYDGEWKNDMKNGYGEYTYHNGDTYKGSWLNDKRHSLGTYTFALDDCKFYGTWQNGVRLGPMEIQHKNHRFHGYWKNSNPFGKGVYSFNAEHVVKGFINLVRDPVYDNVKMDDGVENMYTPIWCAKEILKFDYSLLPEEPIQLPCEEIPESICEQSIVPSEDELMEFDKGEEHLEECPCEDVEDTEVFF